VTADDRSPAGPATTMTAAVFAGPGAVEIEERPVPAVGPHDVLVEVSHCGVCGSDLHFALEGWARPGTIGGHEYSGRVVAVGDAVSRWSVGDEVVGGPEPRCGSCRWCRTGRPSLCDSRDTPGKSEFQGAFARYIRVDERQLIELPAGLSFREAALAEPLAVALHAVTQAGDLDQRRVLVLGLGPIGQLIVAVLVQRGLSDVHVVEPTPLRQELASGLGAASVRGPDGLDVPSIAEPERIVDDAVDVVFECSGRRSAMEAGLAQLRRGGRLVLVGAGIEPPRFDPNRIVLNELIVTGSYVYDADGFDVALDLLASGALPTNLLIDPTDVPLSGLLESIRSLAAGRTAAKVMVVPGPLEETP
jgi:L-iditol 2-dehydrogenase